MGMRFVRLVNPSWFRAAQMNGDVLCMFQASIY